MKDISKSEAEKCLKTIDLRITAHAILSEKLRLWANISDYLLISATIMLTITSFAPAFFIEIANCSALFFNKLTCFFSLIVLLYTILAWKKDWKGKSFQHEHARHTLSRLKVSGRSLLANATTDTDMKLFLTENSSIQALIIPLPESQFNKLKARHMRKIELSKFISSNPELRPFLSKLKFEYISFIKLFTK